MKDLEEEDLNLFFYHFKTKFDMLCAVNGHLVVTILDECKQTGADNLTKKMLIWEEALNYISKEVFLDHEEDDSVTMDHMQAMENIKCYNNLGIELDEWCNLTWPVREHIKNCIHSGSHPCIQSILWSEWSVKTEEEIIEKEGLENLYYSTDAGFYSTDKRYPVMGDCYMKHIYKEQKEDFNPFLYHFETGYDCLCNRNRHLVLRILDGCKFELEEASLIWKEALDYVNCKLFLDHEKGNTYATIHIGGMAIILLYLLCGYPTMKGKADNHCYDTTGIRPKVDLQEGNKLEQDEHETPNEDYGTNTEQVDEVKAQLTERKFKEEEEDAQQFKNKEEKKEQDKNERNIWHWLHLYHKRWNSPEDLEEYNKNSVHCGAWGRVKK
eukprot:jgi/Psemu1/34727/gm1.34727_g